LARVQKIHMRGTPISIPATRIPPRSLIFEYSMRLPQARYFELLVGGTQSVSRPLRVISVNVRVNRFAQDVSVHIREGRLGGQVQGSGVGDLEFRYTFREALL